MNSVKNNCQLKKYIYQLSHKRKQVKLLLMSFMNKKCKLTTKTQFKIKKYIPFYSSSTDLKTIYAFFKSSLWYEKKNANRNDHSWKIIELI